MNAKLALKTPKNLVRNQNGQLTIFLAIGLTIFLTMTAFIINVGLFVKAKINLQNATDAAAWSGASVQARQLTQISYLNFEIRNVYKEWLFKYYVLGNLGHSQRITDADFRLRPAGGLSLGTNYDRFNVPSVCVHAGTGTNDICLSSFVPGLPRFETIDLPNITSESQEFIDKIASKKGDDCSFRSAINYATTLIWTYGTGASLSASSDLPALTSGRIGAWPAAFVLGARIRTLEAMVNRPPENNLCANGGDCTVVTSLNLRHVANERPIKAFFAGYRNYSGGGFKETNGSMDETASSFRLEELSPQEFDATPDSLSGMLIPTESPPWNQNLLKKRYLDLQAVPVNYTIFYTTFSARSQDLVIGSQVLNSDAECTTVKTAMPVPAYLTGFQKNPEVLTYYAVRTKVKFSGLFFPFSEPLELTAVAAAKPFGGRIGPKLFQVEGNTEIRPRTTGTETKSAPNLSGLEVIAGESVLNPGTPIPTGQDFWIADTSSTIGGVPNAGIQPRFAIPNMVYNFSSAENADSEILFGGSASGDPFEKLKRYSSATQAKRENFGIYHPPQFQRLKSNLIDSNGDGILSTAELTASIAAVREPTYYDALNYLIPTISDNPGLGAKATTSSFSDTSGNPLLRIYAPLIDDQTENSIYQTADSLKVIAQSFIASNNESIIKFLRALKDVALAIKGSGSGDLYEKAANIIFPLNLQPEDAAGLANEMRQSAICGGANANVSVAARFSSFFQQNTATCANAKPLSLLIGEYISALITANTGDTLYHIDTWFDEGAGSRHVSNPKDLMTGYRPGVLQGANDDGQLQNPIAPGNLNNRNYYSTKFIQFDIISNNPRSKLIGGKGATLMEENDGGIFVINADVKDQISGDYKNKLIDTIDVRW